MRFVAVLVSTIWFAALGMPSERAESADFDPEQFFVRTCQGCHNPQPAPRAHPRTALEAMPPERVLRALTGGGLMGAFAIVLSDPERRALAEHLSSRPWSPQAAGAVAKFPSCPTDGALKVSALSGPHWSGWGIDLANTRFQPASQAKLSRTDLAKLELRWAVGFDGSTTVGTQPAVVGDRLFLGSPEGRLYALDAHTGCLYWQIETDGPIRGTPTVTPDEAGEGLVVHVGDREGYLYAIDVDDGKLLWKVRVDEHPDAVITGSPVVHQGRVYAVVASLEELTAAAPDYECCTFRGSVVVHDAATGKRIWQRYIIEEEPKPTRVNSKGVQLYGPSGAGIWGAPTIDPTAGVLYVTTGDSYSQPAAPNSDAVVAYDLATGARKWSKQTTAGDAYTAACLDENSDPQTLEECGPDVDYGASAILKTNASGRRVLLAGQKSGVLHALDPNSGELLWKQRLSPGGIIGGIEWGFAVDDRAAYVPISDVWENADSPGAAGGLFAVDFEGNILWHRKPEPPDCLDFAAKKAAESAPPAAEATDANVIPPIPDASCTAGQPQAATAIPGIVFVGSMDGHMRAYATETGDILWDYDTKREFQTVNEIPGVGGSLNGAGATVVDGWLYFSSGYGVFGLPGNVMLAFGPPRE